MLNLEFRKSNPAIGLLTRTPTHGPELDMLENAAPNLIDLFSRKKHDVAVFWEPKVDVGFPDLVIAIFSPKAYEAWAKERASITNADLKLAHHLFNCKGMSSVELEQMLGIPSRELLRSLERLLDAGLIRRASSKWCLRPFSKIFGIQRLIAIEAKLSNWTDAFIQAESNLWFASESYVLSPVARPRPATQDRSSTHGVGILSSGSNIPETIMQAPRRRRLPTSYASWQFNEWIGREITRN